MERAPGWPPTAAAARLRTSDASVPHAARRAARVACCGSIELVTLLIVCPGDCVCICACTCAPLPPASCPAEPPEPDRSDMAVATLLAELARLLAVLAMELAAVATR